jgi:signal transduction histidine kinase
VSHGVDRAGSGFDLAELVSEYRALRGSVLSLWRGSRPAVHATDLDDLTRFNETIDPSLTAAVLGYSDAAKRTEAQLATERAARAGAEAANRAKDAFLATLSHELRTPLNAIVMWLGILTREGCGPNEIREGLDVIGRNTKTQIRLIEDILDVSRIVSGNFRLDRRTCGVAEIVAAAVEAVRPDAARRGVAVDVRLDLSDPIRASCDPDRVQRIV